MAAQASQQLVRTILDAVDETDCPREGYRLVKETIDNLEANGSSIPAELLRMRRSMELDCMLQSQGR